MSFALLGALRVQRAECTVELGAPRQRAVLVSLLLRPDSVVSMDQLIADIWGEEPPGSPVVAIRSYISQLRKLLEPVRRTPTVLLSQAGGYRLSVPPHHIDLFQARRLRELARSCAPEQAREHLRQALQLWRGEPLLGLPGPLVERERQRLAELRLTLLEERLALDEPADCLTELQALAAEHPFREQLQALLIRALQRTGRTTEARAAYDALHSRLVEHLGIEPSPELTALRDELDPDQLPSDPAHFTGRQQHVAAIARALTDRATPGLRLVTITGMAGVGKTALALRTAHTLRPDFPDGRLHADLRGADLVPASAADILADFLTALGVTPPSIPRDLAGRAALFRTASAGKRLLVLLDNARDDAQIQPLLPGSSDCAVIVTSRAMLTGVSSVLHVPLDVFDTREALALLDSVIGTTRRSTQPDDAELLVEACGFLPLAVRIAAARLAATPDQPIADLLARLANDREGISVLRTRDLAVEQVFDLSYRLLPPPLATAFRQLSWVEPDIGTAAAAAVLDLPEHQAEHLAEALVDQALLESIGAGRYRFHDLVRAFARRTSLRLEADERATAQSRLLTLLLGNARTAFALAVPGDPVADVFGEPITRPVFADLPEARHWARSETPGAIALAAAVATVSPALLREAVDLLIALSPLGLGAFAGRAEETARLLIAAAMRARDRAAEGRARFLLGTVLLGRARLDEAAEQARRAALACQEANDPAVHRQALNDLGVIAQAQGRHQEAITAFDQAADLARRLGHRSGEVASTANAALSRIRSGRVEDAVETCRRLLTEPGDAAMTAYVHYVLGLAYQELGRLDAAAVQLQCCVDCAGRAGDLDRESAARSRLADVLRLLGRVDEAVREAEEALRLATQGGRQRERALAHLVLANAMTALGDHRTARDHATEAHRLLSGLGAPESADAESLLTALATAAGS
ncbi:BTAD domain-containing putative transcriptional regulator [Kitasatospora sp. NPDC089509]|uniref:AfsR/SARP family transcriptional regulator n=1 Tax=Kitasatospora sp. NPDC089509 TaxID=3364079 RepID=UPI0038034B1F